MTSDAFMKLLRKICRLLGSGKLDTEMAEEMRAHLELQAAENERKGMSAEEARYAARRAFGGVEQIKERCRDTRRGRGVWLEQIFQDVRYAVRQLRRSPGFAVTAIAILALGIGATTAVFSVVHAIVLRPLRYDDGGQLVRVFEASRPGNQNSVSSGVFRDWREHPSDAFAEFAAYSGTAMNFTGNGEPERLDGLRMSANALSLLRARPLLGRTFAPEEDQPGAAKVVVLTHELWARRFGNAGDIVGRSLLLNGEPYTVIGVLPAGFLPFQAQEFVVPLVIDPNSRDTRSSHWLSVIARLRPGVRLEQAQAELTALTERNKPLFPAWKQNWTAWMLPLREQLVRDIKPALLVLLGAVGLVLLVACANVANLLLAKASARQKEIAVRVALGASRGRIVRQLLAESLVLSLGGASIGLLLAVWSVDALRNLAGAMNLARTHEIALDGPVLGLALLAALATGGLFGLAPALQLSRPDPNATLKDSGRGTAAQGNRLRGALIVGEVALALVLLVGAGLLLHSFSRLTKVPPGFATANALTLQLTLTDQKYPNRPLRAAFYNRVAERLTALPGVEAAGLSISLPLHHGPYDRFFRIAGRTDHPEPGYGADFDVCTADYFRAMGIPLLRGRAFTPSEVAGDGRVAIVNRTMAQQYFPGEDPIGRMIGHDGEWWEIVGIVGDVRMRSLLGKVQPMLYRPQAGDAWRSATLVVRTKGPPLAIVEGVRQMIRELDPTLPIAQVQPLEKVVARSIGERRLTLALLVGFAIAALVLAAIGLYGVIAYAVAQRTRELGIRLALGATRGDVLWLVLRQGMALVTLGLVLGLFGAFSVSRVLTNLLFEITPTDPMTFAAVSGLLLLVALGACWLPARRAAKVDPMVALRADG